MGICREPGPLRCRLHEKDLRGRSEVSEPAGELPIGPPPVTNTVRPASSPASSTARSAVAVGSTQAASTDPSSSGIRRKCSGKAAISGASAPSACRPSAVSNVACRQKFGRPDRQYTQVPSTLPFGLTATRWPAAHLRHRRRLPRSGRWTRDRGCTHPGTPAAAGMRADHCRRCRTDRLRSGPDRVAASGQVGPVVRSYRVR